MYIPDEKKVAWIAEYFESKTTDLTADQRKAILEKLVQATGFESFFQTKYVGQKRFSLEGLEATIPALDALIQSASEKGWAELIASNVPRICSSTAVVR